MRNPYLKSVERHNGALTIAIALAIIFICVAAAGFLLMENEKQQDEILSLNRENAELRELLIEREADNAVLNEKLRELDDLRKEVKEIKEILTGAREAEKTVTFYAPLDENAVEGVCYSGNPSITASGAEVVPGVTVAARGIPFGTRLWVEGYGMRTVQDRGGRIGVNDLDIAVRTREEALERGRTTARVLVLE